MGQRYSQWPPVTAILWLALIPFLLFTCLTSFVTPRLLLTTCRALRAAWIYAAICALFVAILRDRLQSSWDNSSTTVVRFLQVAAFQQSRWVLHFFYPVVVADSATHILGTRNFVVEVAGSCSGLEGLALMSVFLLPLAFLRASQPATTARAASLAPFALGLMWSLNVLRLVLLIAIGNAGHPAVAINGFHAQAGWIFFNGAALAVLVAAQRMTWLQKPPALAVSGTHEPNEQNPTATYLLPFLAIVVASFITQATSSGFEWLYPLRFVLAACVLFYFRKDYRRLDWRCGWLGAVSHRSRRGYSLAGTSLCIDLGSA